MTAAANSEMITPRQAFWRELRKGIIGGLFWGSIHGAIIGYLHIDISWKFAFSFGMMFVAVWLPITTTVGFVRGIKRMQEVIKQNKARAEAQK
jgi:Mg/Co/Ni transporter MgtE